MTETKPLLAFAAVMEHGSMNAAARALSMTPSAVSQHITRLEKLHGVKLLKRSTRRLAPTDAGLVLAEHCLRLQYTLADIQTALDSVKTQASGLVRVALPTALTSAPAFQTALLLVAERYPNIRVQLVVADALADLQQHEIDIALRGGDSALSAPNLVARHLVDWRWQICAAPSYIAKMGLPQKPSDVLTWRWLNAVPVRYAMQRGDEVFYLNIAETWQCGDLMTVRQLTAAGLGVSVQLTGDIQQWVDEGKLTVLLPEWKLPVVSLYAVTPHRVQTAKVAAVLGALQECFV